MDEKLLIFREQISDFIFVSDRPEKADVIFVPGNRYPQMAEHAAGLWKQGYAPYVLPSGKFSITDGKFTAPIEKQEIYQGPYRTEWEFLQDVLIKQGVEQGVVLKEDCATYTYENALFSRKVLDCQHRSVHKAILCCKSCHARRCLMYYQLAFPETEIMVCPVDVEGIGKDNWFTSRKGIQEVLGEVHRIIEQFHILMK